MGDIVVGERLQIGGVTRQVAYLGRREVEDGQSLTRTDEHLVLLGVEQGGDVVGRQLAILPRVRREGVHLGVEHLHTAVGSNPQVAHSVGTQGVDVVVNQRRLSAVSGRVDGGTSILDAGQSVLLGTHPQAAVLGVLHGRHLVTGNGAVVAHDTVVARSVPHPSAVVLGDGGDVLLLRGEEAVDVLTVVGHTRFLGTHPQQVGIVNINALHPDDVGIQLAGVHVLGLSSLHLVGVDVHAYQSGAVGSHPDVAVAVATHAVHGVVHADARQTYPVAYARVPYLGVLVIDEERALTVEPDVVHLVGKGLQRVRPPQLALGNLVGTPHRVLLVHHVAAHHATVVIDDQRTVAALADRADGTLRYAYTFRIVGIGELIEQLLLHVVADDALVGDGAPHVLVLVDVNNLGDALDTHAGKGLLHVALERLGLRVIDAVACRRVNPQRTIQGLLNAVDVAVGQRGTVLRVALEILERIAVEAVQAGRRAKPDVASTVLQYAVNLATRQAVLGIERLEQVDVVLRTCGANE